MFVLGCGDADAGRSEDAADDGDASVAADAGVDSDEADELSTSDTSDTREPQEAVAPDGRQDDDISDTHEASEASETDTAHVMDTAGPEDCSAPRVIGSRRITPTGGVVVLNELAFGAAWLELHNQMAVDVDISGWRLEGAVAYLFPEGTIVPGGQQLVVANAPATLAPVSALGPWQGALARASGVLRLYNNSERLMDTMTWSDRAPWPSLDPEHPVLAKREPDLASALGENWAASAIATPGVLPVLDTGTLALSDGSSLWRYSDTLSGDWTLIDFDAETWNEGAAPFASGDPGPVAARARFTADNAFALYLGQADGGDLRLVARDAVGDWETAEDFDIVAAPGEHLFVAAWEAPGDSGSPQMLIGEVTSDGDLLLATARDTFDALLGPTDANPGGGLGDAPPTPTDLALIVAARRDDFAAPLAERERTGGPWGGVVGAAFSAGRFVWLDTFDPASLTNSANTYALFRSRLPIARPAGSVLAPATSYYFRRDFVVASDPAVTRFAFTLEASDGVAVYLNGSEILRDNLPDGPLDERTAALGLARLSLAGMLPSALVRAGNNTLAVAVHSADLDPAALATANLRFAMTLEATATTSDPAPPVDHDDIVIDELMFHPAADGASEWIELFNRGAVSRDLAGWQLADAVGHVFASGTIIEAGGFLVVADDVAAFRRDYPAVPARVPVVALASGGLGNDGEQLVLIDACGHTVDAVRYSDGGRWPANADGGGSSLALVDPRADNGVAEAWVASDESKRSGWQQIRYRAVAAPSPVGPDGTWQELVLGLLGAGEVLIDDVSVVESPDGDANELVTNGGFDALLSDWQAIGTHRESRLEPDPDDPANPVLHIVASGPTDHMHNQVVTPLARAVTNGVTYEVSFRARWVAGDVQLNSRLYFNRLARTTRLAAPPGGGTPGGPNTLASTNLGPTFAGFSHAPLVPHEGESVVVTAFARDPDGVTALTLWSSADAGDFSATPMQHVAGTERYEATLAGQSFGSVVQFYVAARDSRGASTMFPARGPASRALYQVGDALTATRLHGLRILMTPPDSERFLAMTERMSNADTGCTVIYDERQVFYDIGVRAKGSERGRPSDARLGFHVSFDPLLPLRGIYESVAIDRSEGVGTGQREILMDLVLAHAGAVSTEYNDLVQLVAPGGIYNGPALLQTARFGDAMLDNQFADGSDGNVYEYELVYYPTTTDDGTPGGLKLPKPDDVIGVSLRSLGPDREAYRYNYLVKNNRRDDDFSALITFLATFGAPDAVFAANVANVIDVDQWLRAFAFMSLAGAIDHYGAGAQHNVQLYLRPDDGRTLLFPHDLDFFPGSPESPVVGNGDLARLLQLPGNERRFYQLLYEIIQTTYNHAYLAHWRDHLTALLPGQPFASHHDFMVQRAAWVMNGASDAIERQVPPVPFAIAKPAGGVQQATVGSVVVRGQGWLDLHALTRVAHPPEAFLPQAIAFQWDDEIFWSAQLDLPVGLHEVVLEARDINGALVGQDEIQLEVSPP